MAEATEHTAHTQGVLAPSSGFLTPIYFLNLRPRRLWNLSSLTRD